MDLCHVFDHIAGPVLCLVPAGVSYRGVLATPDVAPACWPCCAVSLGDEPSTADECAQAWAHLAACLHAAPVQLVAVLPDAQTDTAPEVWRTQWLARLHGGTQPANPALWLTPWLPDMCPPDFLMHAPAPVLVADAATCHIVQALAVPAVAARSHRQGLVVVHVGEQHVTAFLVYREQVWGVYEQHTALRDVTALVDDLKEFCLAWLPHELVREQGGHGCLLVSPMPEDAEGFAPMFVFGPRADLLTGHGQLMRAQGDADVACGLLWALAHQMPH